MNDKNQEIQDKILKETLEDVPFDGWTWGVVEAAAERAGYDKETARSVFPNKVSGVLRYFSAWADEQMLESLEGVDIEGMRVRDRIRLAVETRLDVLTEHKESVRAASIYWLSPFRKTAAGKIVWASADTMWLWAGDTATDYNHYTKRALLSGVITSTMVAWLNDRSSNNKETLAFLDRRIDNVLTVGGFAGKLMGKFKRKNTK